MRNIIFNCRVVRAFSSTAFGQGSVECTVTNAAGKGASDVSVTHGDANGKTISIRRRIETKIGYIFRFSNPAIGFAVADRYVQ